MNHPRQPVPSGDELGLFVCVLSKEGRNQRLVERTGTRYFQLVKLHKQTFVFSWFQQLRASPGAGQGFQALLGADGVGAAAGTHRPRWETGGLLGILLTFPFLFSRHTKLSLSSTVCNP